MKEYNARMRRLEQKTGMIAEKEYSFLEVVSFSEEGLIKAGKLYCKRNGFIGNVQIWENLGKEYERNIDIGSQEEIELLKKHGYEIIYPSIGQVKVFSLVNP